MVIDDWKKTPLSIDDNGTILNSVDYLISMDETGTQTLDGIDKNTPYHGRMFTLTGILIEKGNINQISSDIMNLKNKYWIDGCFNNHRVIFHSRNIRKKIGPFNPRIINGDSFRKDLNGLLRLIPFEISSASINKYELKRRYIYPIPPYELSVRFILERIAMNLNFHNSTGIILLESRGKKEDKELLSEIVGIIESGSAYMDRKKFNCISGIYFNSKWNYHHDKSYWPLEIADLVSYRIHEHNLTHTDNSDFDIIEERLMRYPSYRGIGNKIFPD